MQDVGSIGQSETGKVIHEMNRHYVIGLDISSKAVLVAGGGIVGERKVLGLLGRGAKVRVVSPTVTETLRALAASETIKWESREVAASDLDGMALAFAATSCPDTNANLAGEARARGIPVNRADSPDACDFIVPSTFSSGNVEVAVFSGGESPFLSKWLRRRVEQEVSQDLAALGELMARVRTELKQMPISQQRRARLLNSVMESDVIDVLKAQGKDPAFEHALELIRAELQVP